MSSKLERIYTILPVFLQNAATSLCGWRYARRRYRRSYEDYVNKLMRSQWFTSEEFSQLQIFELRKLLIEVQAKVPYYGQAFKGHEKDWAGFELADLSELPFLEKSYLREHVEEFTNKDQLKYGYGEGHSSGTTGSPFIWLSDFESNRYNMAFRERQYIWAGVTHRDKSARFSGRILLGDHEGPPYWRRNPAENQWLFSSYHITEETLPIYYEALQKYDFVYLDGYPSPFFSIAKWINQQGKTAQWRPWVIITTAETLMEYQRQEIEKAFGCRIFNYYSSSEGAPFVTTCPAGNMHLNPESGIIEFLRPDGTAAEPEEEAEMVVTSFFNRTLPLIRYRIGDIGVLAGDQKCPCGRQMPVIKYIGGRESNVLYSTERGRISNAGLSTALYKIPSRLQESQIEQTETDAFIFRYVPVGEALNASESKIIVEELRLRLGDSVEIKIEQVDSIAKGPRGKVHPIIGLSKGKGNYV